MNVLHLHLSDEPAIRMESKLYPELTSSLPSDSFYSQLDLKKLIEYAKARAVRIIPEIDVPAHAGGLRSLVPRGLTYCGSPMNTTLSEDSSNLDLLDGLFKEVSELFQDDFIHFGADEACKKDVCPGKCTNKGVHAIEEHVQRNH